MMVRVPSNNGRIAGFIFMMGTAVQQKYVSVKVRLTVFRGAVGAHPYLMGIRVTFSGSKVPRCVASQTPPCSAEVKNKWN